MKRILLVLGLGVILAAAEACSSNESETAGSTGGGGVGGAVPIDHHRTAEGTHRPCAGDPAWCADGETCWPRGDGATWSCLVADTTAKKGDSCVQGPIPSCDIGQFCGGFPFSDVSRCLVFCSDAGECDADEVCTKIDGHADAARFCLGPHTFD